MARKYGNTGVCGGLGGRESRCGTGTPAAAGRVAGEGGFTLLEIMVAVAVMAVLAATVVPLAFRELVRAREDATRMELTAIREALERFYEDTGRLPTDREGLAALVGDPGVEGWSGPYLGNSEGDPVAEVTRDAFGRTYAYDAAPRTDPGGVADAIVVSGGSDRVVEIGRVGGTWRLGTDEDDLVAVVSLGALVREKQRECAAELETIGMAVRRYYKDHARFPDRLTDLRPDYLHDGLDDDALVDPWLRPYRLVLEGGGTVLVVRSDGPDRRDDEGGDDDMSLRLDRSLLGREATYWKWEIAQTVLNRQPDLELTGDWTRDRLALGLADAFATDGWGRPFAVNVASRVVFSTGSDGDAGTVADNVPAGVGP